MIIRSRGKDGHRMESAVAYKRRMKREKDAELARAAVKDRHIDGKVQRMIEQGQAAVERHLVGECGHWIELRETANDGREKFAVVDPAGNLITFIWGKAAAEAAVHQLIEKGAISR